MSSHLETQVVQVAPPRERYDDKVARARSFCADHAAGAQCSSAPPAYESGGVAPYRGGAMANEQPPSTGDYIAAIRERLGERQVKLMFEPGRSITANAGVLLTQVEFLKLNPHKNFAIVDAAMNDMLRPALYQAWMDLLPVVPRSNGEARHYDVVGPVCETGDFIAKDRELRIESGDLLALASSGAYGFTMSSNYNSRGRAAEVMVDGDQHHLIRARETVADLMRGEAVLPD